jgi:hypothetical protein
VVTVLGQEKRELAAPIASPLYGRMGDAGLGSTMPAAQTMVQWAAGVERLGVATAAVSFSRSIAVHVDRLNGGFGEEGNRAPTRSCPTR